MELLSVFLVALASFQQLQAAPSAEVAVEKSEELNPLLARALISNDFENAMEPWFDFSNGDVNWYLEEFASPLEPSAAPRPEAGVKYLRAVRKGEGSSGTAVLRSPVFTAYPGDLMTFDFWIRSRHLGSNNLEVYWLNGTREQRLLSLSEYSSPANYEWRTASVSIPAAEATNTRITIYGFCGYNEEDAIAIDNISVGSSATTTTPSTTAASSSTTTTLPATTQVPCPTYAGGNLNFPCFRSAMGCYCFYQGSKTWAEADISCRSYGSKLLAIESQAEQEEIERIFSQNSLAVTEYYTSAKRSGTEWVWSSTGMDVDAGFENWAFEEPNNSGDCQVLYPAYYYFWYDTPCSSSYHFICEY